MGDIPPCFESDIGEGPEEFVGNIGYHKSLLTIVCGRHRCERIVGQAYWGSAFLRSIEEIGSVVRAKKEKVAIWIPLSCRKGSMNQQCINLTESS